MGLAGSPSQAKPLEERSKIMELIFIGFNGLLLLAVWNLMLKKTILDTHRDRLFELRDHLREQFINNGWSLESPIYRRLRDLINGYLRFTTRFSLAKFLFLESNVKKNKELTTALKIQLTKEFSVATDEQLAFVEQFRRQALSVMMDYMILSSGPLIICTVILIPFVALYVFAHFLIFALRRGGLSMFEKTVEFKKLLAAAFKLTIAVIAKKFVFEDFLEELSYRQKI